ncbi:hypothetical protein AXG93_3217s1530 [Marchantia polymorpha subsp. ruderalis]|uniref:Uncharacterized protein n=1 Tax=Marchantia polymorpha subsp. ruderalis TaxID=1480154 RepID=A0A176VZ21_MARPO|nr:hypothetical protein AXG93_3217s1530 [Marchantia polymorpha subsp. ruderalis]
MKGGFVIFISSQTYTPQEKNYLGTILWNYGGSWACMQQKLNMESTRSQREAEPMGREHEDEEPGLTGSRGQSQRPPTIMWTSPVGPTTSVEQPTAPDQPTPEPGDSSHQGGPGVTPLLLLLLRRHPNGSRRPLGSGPLSSSADSRLWCAGRTCEGTRAARCHLEEGEGEEDKEERREKGGEAGKKSCAAAAGEGGGEGEEELELELERKREQGGGDEEDGGGEE